METVLPTTLPTDVPTTSVNTKFVGELADNCGIVWLMKLVETKLNTELDSTVSLPVIDNDGTMLLNVIVATPLINVAMLLGLSN